MALSRQPLHFVVSRRAVTAMGFVDGIKSGDIHFPGGEMDLTAACRPGAAHRMSLLVAALPLKGVMLSYTDSASAREVKGTVERRGLCGNVFLD